MKKLISGALDDGRPLRGSVERHVAGCADCRAYHERLIALHRALSVKADEQAASARMHARIMAGVRNEARPKAIRPMFKQAFVPVTALAALCVIVVLTLRSGIEPTDASERGQELVLCLDRGLDGIEAMLEPRLSAESLKEEATLLEEDLANAMARLEALLDCEIVKSVAR